MAVGKVKHQYPSIKKGVCVKKGGGGYSLLRVPMAFDGQERERGVDIFLCFYLLFFTVLFSCASVFLSADSDKN